MEFSKLTLAVIKANTHNELKNRPFTNKIVKGCIANDTEFLQCFVNDLRHDCDLCKSDRWTPIVRLNRQYQHAIEEIDTFLQQTLIK